MPVSPCGFIVRLEQPWLGATPDGIVDDGTILGVLEIICPYSAQDMSFTQAVTSWKNFCLRRNDSTFILKRTHAYYYQVQVQLFILGFCCLVTSWWYFY